VRGGIVEVYTRAVGYADRTAVMVVAYFVLIVAKSPLSMLLVAKAITTYSHGYPLHRDMRGDAALDQMSRVLPDREMFAFNDLVRLA
jgi:hypothetical protein